MIIWTKLHSTIFLNFLLSVVLSINQQNICKKLIEAHHSNNATEKYILMGLIQTNNHFQCAIYLKPMYQWAQNMTHLFIKFQFINSASTSSCSHVLWKKQQVQHSFMRVQLGCIQSQNLLIYDIQIQTLMPLNQYHASWRQEEQNSIVLQCLKSPSPYFWKRLKLHVKQGERINIWWQMMRKYQQNMKQYLGDLQFYEKDIVLSKGRKGKFTKDINLNFKQKGKSLFCGGNSLEQLGIWLNL